ncbi:MAG: alpha hydrolase [Methanomicrobiales archaeon]|jgi:predicted subunit of tRNA(5-methylaminomethyl-2-thiouridylate) methyltransferase|nr:alpha hydrolase [Methanomicrobiales archaeon]
MKQTAGVLFSGGKDSSLAALLLSKHYTVELNTFVFDPAASVAAVKEAADALGFIHHIRVIGGAVLDRLTQQIISDGYPNHAINAAHLAAIEHLSKEYKVIGDGTRHGDRVPMLSPSEVSRLYDRDGCTYVRPLLGFPKPAIEYLCSRYLTVTYGETGTIENGDYEREIHSRLMDLKIDVSGLFPKHHMQSLVTASSFLVSDAKDQERINKS